MKKYKIKSLPKAQVGIEKEKDLDPVYIYPTEKKRKKFGDLMDQVKAFGNTFAGRIIDKENLYPDRSMQSMQQYVQDVKEYQKQAAEYQKARRLVKQGKMSTDGFADRYERNNWARFDKNVRRNTAEEQAELEDVWYGTPDEQGRRYWMDDPRNVAQTAKVVAGAAPLAPVAIAAAPTIMTATGAVLGNPLVQAGLTGYGVYDATTNSIPEAYRDFSEGRYLEGLGNTAMAALDLAPIPVFGTNLLDEAADAVKYSKDLINKGKNLGKYTKQLGKEFDAFIPGSKSRLRKKRASTTDQYFKTEKESYDLEKDYIAKGFEEEELMYQLMLKLPKEKPIPYPAFSKLHEKDRLKKYYKLEDDALIAEVPSPYIQTYTINKDPKSVINFRTGESTIAELTGSGKRVISKVDDTGKLQHEYALANELGVSSDYVKTLEDNITYVEESLPGSKVFGSAAGVTKGGIPHITKDIDVVMTRKDYDKIKDKFKYLGDNGPAKLHELDPRFGEDGHIDINIIEEGANGLATGDRAREVFRQFFPEDFTKANKKIMAEAAKIKDSAERFEFLRTAPLEINKTPEELMEAFDPVTKSIVDAYEIGHKPKHINRIDLYITHGDPDAVIKAQKTFIDSVVGGKGDIGKQFPLETLSDPERNLELLKPFSNRYPNIEKIAEDPKRMQAFLNDIYINASTFSRQVQMNPEHINSLEELEDAFNTWKGEGGSAMGQGLNTVRLGNPRHGDDYTTIHGNIQFKLYDDDINTPEELLQSLKNKTSGARKIKNEDLALIKNIAEKHNVTSDLPKNLEKFEDLLRVGYGNAEKYGGFYEDLGREFGMKAISKVGTGSGYGNSIYASTLQQFDKTFDNLALTLQKNMPAGGYKSALQRHQNIKNVIKESPEAAKSIADFKKITGYLTGGIEVAEKRYNEALDLATKLQELQSAEKRARKYISNKNPFNRMPSDKYHAMQKELHMEMENMDILMREYSNRIAKVNKVREGLGIPIMLGAFSVGAIAFYDTIKKEIEKRETRDRNRFLRNKKAQKDTEYKEPFSTFRPQYQAGGSIEIELTPKEIQWYIDNGYVVEEINEYQDGGLIKAQEGITVEDYQKVIDRTKLLEKALVEAGYTSIEEPEDDISRLGLDKYLDVLDAKYDHLSDEDYFEEEMKRLLDVGFITEKEADVTRKEWKDNYSGNNYRNVISPFQFEQRDLAAGNINRDLPIPLYDRRLIPSSYKIYKGTNNGYDDHVNLFMYDVPELQEKMEALKEAQAVSTKKPQEPVEQNPINTVNLNNKESKSINYRPPRKGLFEVDPSTGKFIRNTYQDGGDVISSYGWDYKKEGDQYFTRKTGTEDWITPQGEALQAIKQKIYNEVPYTTQDRRSEYLTNLQNLVAQGYSIDDLVKMGMGTRAGLVSILGSTEYVEPTPVKQTKVAETPVTKNSYWDPARYGNKFAFRGMQNPKFGLDMSSVNEFELSKTPENVVHAKELRRTGKQLTPEEQAAFDINYNPNQSIQDKLIYRQGDQPYGEPEVYSAREVMPTTNYWNPMFNTYSEAMGELFNPETPKYKAQPSTLDRAFEVANNLRLRESIIPQEENLPVNYQRNMTPEDNAAYMASQNFWNEQNKNLQETSPEIELARKYLDYKRNFFPYLERYAVKEGWKKADSEVVDVKDTEKVKEATPEAETFYETLKVTKDDNWRALPGSQLLSYRNQWDANKGFTFINSGHKSPQRDINKVYDNVQGVGHFILDATPIKGQTYMHFYNFAELDKNINNDDFVPIFREDPMQPGYVNMQYKRPSEMTQEELEALGIFEKYSSQAQGKNDSTKENLAKEYAQEIDSNPVKIVAPLRQLKFDDIDFKSSVRAAGFDSARYLKTKDGKETKLIFTDPKLNKYGRFDGLTVSFVFKDEYGNTIVRDFTGPILEIQEEGKNIKKTYNLKDDELIIGYHDVGSFSGKPAAKDGKLPVRFFDNYNNYDGTGSALIIPKEPNVPMLNEMYKL